VLTGINLLNYVDRYVFSALLEPIKHELGFSDTQLGLLGSAFILSYLFVSPIFGYLGDRGGRARIMSLGVALWSVATAFTGIASRFSTQLATRVMVGVGESAYSVIAPSTIADYFSRESRGRVFAVYSGAITVGSALGFILGGWLEPLVGWRGAFFVVGLPGLLLASLLFFLPNPNREGSTTSTAETTVPLHLDSFSLRSLLHIYRRLLTNGGLLTTILGYAAYTFVVGGMSFWMPSFIVRYFSVSLAKANTTFGAVTVVGGFAGTLLGGWWADSIETKSGNGFLKVCVWSMALSILLFPFVFSSYAMSTFWNFTVALFFMEIVLFMCLSPLDAGVVSFVKPEFRATAMALNIFLIHLLGDGVSRTLMGAISDVSNLQTAVLSLIWALALAGVIWIYGLIFYWQAKSWPQQALRLVPWQSHRGYRLQTGVLENTIEAFRCAKRAGAQMIELDVQLTQDAEAVVFHDEDLVCMCSDSRKLVELTSQQIQKMTGAPLLSEVLTDPDVPRFINIELKSDKLIEGRLERAVVKAVELAGAESRVLFSSFNPLVLRRLSKLMPEVPRALLVTQVEDPRNWIWLRKMWLGVLARPHLLHVDDTMVTAKSLRNWQERGLRVAVWTVNDRTRASELLAMGVDSVISDILVTDQAV
jgi:glycerophosphoryl diester phosphodiesterase/MFS family permease